MNVPGGFSFNVLRDFKSSLKRVEVRPSKSAFADCLTGRLDGITNVRITYGACKGSRAEILEKFPNLTPEKLDRLLDDYDIESMDSEQLYKLVEELAEDGVIPARPDENGLNQMAVIPRALYDVFLRGDASIFGGVVRKASGFVCLTDPSGSGQGVGIPQYGLARLRYESELLEQSFKRFEQYYTSEELQRHVQLSGSRVKFLELAELLTAYKEQLAVQNRIRAEKGE